MMEVLPAWDNGTPAQIRYLFNTASAADRLAIGERHPVVPAGKAALIWRGPEGWPVAGIAINSAGEVLGVQSVGCMTRDLLSMVRAVKRGGYFADNFGFTELYAVAHPHFQPERLFLHFGFKHVKDRLYVRLHSDFIGEAT